MEKSTVTVYQLEQKTYSRDYNGALKILLELLERLDRVAASRSLRTSTREKTDQFNLYTRIAAAVSCLIGDPKFELNFGAFSSLMLHKRAITAIFRVSSFSTMDHLVALSANPSGGQQAHTSISGILKGVLCATIESPKLNAEAIVSQLPPMERAIFWISLLDRDYYLSEQDEDRRRDVLKLAHYVEESHVPPLYVLRLSNVWMTSSYFNDPEKHQVKKTLNRIIKNSLVAEGVQPPSPRRMQTVERPRLAVLSEWFASWHVMYRSYGPLISKLSESFTLILVSVDDCTDDISNEMFDEVVIFPVSTSFPDIMKKIAEVKADVVYYPSIGMQAWTTAACQLRFAPIQIMTLGHPATSMSDEMDYVLVPEWCMGDPDCFSETVVEISNETLRFEKPPKLAEVEHPGPLNTTDRSKIKIAVPSNGYKLNAEFLGCLQKIADRSENEVEFHLFPNLPEHLALEVDIHCDSLFPHIIHMGTDYGSYMGLIGQCDLQISPFPFGNTNGYIDGLLMGLPIVSMSGPEVHNQIDNALGKRAGLPDFCLTSNTEEYVASVIQLVDDEPLRLEVAKSVRELDFDSVFFDSGSSSGFLEAISWIYENHEQNQEADKKYWRLNEWNN